MRQKTERHQDAADRTVKDIRRQIRKRYSAEEKIRIVLAGLRGEDSIAELCGLMQQTHQMIRKRLIMSHYFGFRESTCFFADQRT